MFDGDFARFTVSDDELGITTAALKQIFDPFFSTKSTPKSSGMGLSMTHGLVHQHGGHVLARSRPDLGTSVSVYLLPCFEAVQQVPVDEAYVAPEPGGLSLADAIASFLVDHGHEVVSFSYAGAAFDKIEAAPWATDLIITDQTMLRLSGIEFARAVPGLRAVLEKPVNVYELVR